VAARIAGTGSIDIDSMTELSLRHKNITIAQRCRRIDDGSLHAGGE
jgi:hypothetical protein